MSTFMKCAGLLATLALATTAPLAAQDAAGGGTDPVGEKLTYPIEFDTVEVYLMTLVPENGRENVKNLALTSADQVLRVDADVNLGGVKGFELFSVLGFTHLTATGPVVVVRPGVVAWEVRTMNVGGTPIAQSMWAPLLQRATKREDTLVPFRVGAWVQKVDVQPTRLVLH
ncbi:MAG TPA: hypothetical protein VFY20_06010 [Gemmatimonadales bacterium]|nr:hypothetical protein [Gemmatimonadales bacterium]